MTVISIEITESSEQIVFGIPRSITLTTNIPSTIFYTLDGTDPDMSSNIYVSPIFLPTDSQKVILKIFASNGAISSSIIEEIYQSNILNNTRLPHSATTAQAQESISGLYPYGNPPIQPNAQFTSPSDAGITVYNPSLPSIPTGYDGDGYQTGYTNEEYNVENYSIIYSTRDANGQYGPGIGNIPSKITVDNPDPPPNETDQFSKLFDPRAFVIFQDFSKENPNDPPQINRQFFSLEDPERSRDGVSYYNSGLDSPPVMGSFLRSHFNPRDNTITYYYLDTHTNKWIISKAPYTPTGTFDGNLSQVKFGRNKFVYEWIPFTRRVLF